LEKTPRNGFHFKKESLGRYPRKQITGKAVKKQRGERRIYGRKSLKSGDSEGNVSATTLLAGKEGKKKKKKGIANSHLFGDLKKKKKWQF